MKKKLASYVFTGTAYQFSKLVVLKSYMASALLAIFAFPSMVAAGFINPGFETGDFGGWTVNGTEFGVVSAINGFSPFDEPHPLFSGGNYFAYSVATSSKPAELSQSIVTTAGQYYGVSALLARDTGPIAYDLLWNNEVFFQHSFANYTNPQRLFGSFQIGSILGTGNDLFTLRLYAESATVYVMDDFHLIETSAPPSPPGVVPEPTSTTIWCIGGLIMTVVCRFRRERTKCSSFWNIAFAPFFVIGTGLSSHAQTGALTFSFDASSKKLSITGTLGNDRIVINELSNGAVTLNGTPILGTRPKSMYISAMAGDDYIEINSPVGAEIRCGRGNDTCYGGAGNDTIWGDIGNDFINGRIGNDTIYGGDGNDTLFGGQQNDFLSGDNGEDYISGDVGRDELTGGAGADTFIIGGFWGREVVVNSNGIGPLRYRYLYDRIVDFGNGRDSRDR